MRCVDVTSRCRSHQKAALAIAAGSPAPHSSGGFTIPSRNVPGKVAKESCKNAPATHAIDAEMAWEATYRKGAGVALGRSEKCEHCRILCLFLVFVGSQILPKCCEPKVVILFSAIATCILMSDRWS